MNKLFDRLFGTRYRAALAITAPFFGLLLLLLALAAKYMLKAYLLYLTLKRVKTWLRRLKPF